MSLASEALEALLKTGSKTARGVKTAGRWSQSALDNIKVGGVKTYPEAIEEASRIGLISNKQRGLALTNQGQIPQTWRQQQGANWDGIPLEEQAEYAGSLARKPGDSRPATIALQEQLSGVSNPKHRVLTNPDEAIAELNKVSDKIAERVRYFKEQESRLIADRKNNLPLLRDDGRPASNQKGAYDEAIDRARRSANDWASTSPAKVVAEWIGDMGKTGYRAAKDLPGGKISGQGPLRGKLQEIIEQHHGIGNQEGADMMKQTAFVNEVFKLNVWQYIAKQYKTGLGKSRANMWNIPASIHRGEKVGLHAWLKDLGFDSFWKKQLAANPNMTQQEIMDTIDLYFDEIFYPSLIHVENLVMGSTKKFAWKGMHLPKEVLKDAKIRLVQIEEEIRASEAWKFDDVRDLEGFGTQAERGALDTRVEQVIGNDVTLNRNRGIIEKNDELTDQISSPFGD